MIAVVVAVSAVGLLGLFVVAAQSPSADRSFSASSVAPDGVLTVTIAASGYGSVGQVVETLPEGFIYMEDSVSPADEVRVAVEGQVVKFTLAGATSFSYKVTAPSAEDDYVFEGILKDAQRVERNVGGAVDVSVVADAEPEPTEVATPDSGTTARASRSFSASSVAPDGVLTVTIAASGYGSVGQVVETLPEGFIYMEDSVSPADEVRVAVAGQVVKFTLAGATSFNYKVTAPSAEDDYVFEGILKDAQRAEQNVGGAVDVSVVVDAEPEPTVVATPDSGTMAKANRSFSASSVAPDGVLTVTIRPSGYGSVGQVVETLPDGFTYMEDSASPADEVRVVVEGQVVKFTLAGAMSFSYKVTAPTAEEGEFVFYGILKDAERAEQPVLGSFSTRVGAGAPFSASRSFSASSVAPGRELTVRIRASGYRSVGQVVETLPEGFTYIENSASPADDVRVAVEGQEVKFTLAGAESFSYKVTAPSAEGPYVFKGILKNQDRESQPVTGTFYTQVKAAARATPRPTSRPSSGTGSGSGSGGDTGGESTPAPAVPADNPPIIAGGTREEFNVPENMTAVTSLSVVDGRTVTWSISGGFDAAEFTIGAESGELMFKTAPDFENPTDEGANNVYVVEVGATDSDTLSDTLLVLVTVTDVVDESTATPTPEPTVAPTATPVPTATPTAAPTATSMPEPTATSMPEPTATSAPVATATSMPAATATSAPVATATSMPVAIATSMPVAIATSMPEPTATSMPEPTATAMPAPTAVAPEEPGGGFPILVVGLIVLVVVVVAGAAFYIRSRR